MKILKTITNLEEIQGLFKTWCDKKLPIVIWQQNPEGRRTQTKLNLSPQINNDVFSLVLKSSDWDLTRPFHFSIPTLNYLFKATYLEWQPGRMIFNWPIDVILHKPDETQQSEPQKKLLEKDYMVVKSLSSSNRNQLMQDLGFIALDKEDAKFANMRVHPRTKPKTNKQVLIMFPTGDTIYEELWDLSRGGLGFITRNPIIYNLGDELTVLSFDDTPLDGQLRGTIVAVKEVPINKEVFKIGIKFVDE